MALPLTNLNWVTSISAKISDTASSLVIDRSTDSDGTTLAAQYEITIDEGLSTEEHMIVTFAGSAGTINTRGLSRVDAKTLVAGNRFAHDRGAVVKMTNSILPRIIRTLNGTETIDGTLSYTSHPTFTGNTQVIDKKYADDLAIAGAPDASTTVKGIAKLTTAPSDPTEPIAVGATDVATSGASKVVRSKSDSKLDDSLLALTTAGDLPYSDGTDLQRLAKGAEGTYLRAGATAPVWGGTNLDEANTFFGATDITGAEAETLTAGANSDASSLHRHVYTGMQRLMLNSTLDANRLYTTAATKHNDDSVLVVVESGAAQLSRLTRFAKNASGIYVRTHQVSVASVPTKANWTRAYPVIVGDYVYLCYCDNTSVGIVRRFDLADLANETGMTFSGSAFLYAGNQNPAFTDGTSLYVNRGNTNADKSFYRYTISGTTLTNAATVTYAAAGADVDTTVGIACDGAHVFFAYFSTGTTVAIGKDTLAGAGVSTTTLGVLGMGYQRTEAGGIGGLGYCADTNIFRAVSAEEHYRGVPGSEAVSHMVVMFPIAKP